MSEDAQPTSTPIAWQLSMLGSLSSFGYQSSSVGLELMSAARHSATFLAEADAALATQDRVGIAPSL